jgi:HEAT repeat protein
MISPRRHFTLGFALVSLLALPPMPIEAGDDVPATPTDAEVMQQVGRLDQKKMASERLEAVRWFARNCKADNAHLAIPSLEKCIRGDPDAEVRDAAVMSLTRIAQHRKEPCPLAIVEAVLDEDEFVSQTADALADQFKSYTPGAVEILLRYAQQEDENRRGRSLCTLARAGGKDKKVVAALEKAKADKSFLVRNNAHAAMFAANDNLAEYLIYLIRLQEDPTGMMRHKDANSAAAKKDKSTWDLIVLGSATTIAGWANTRADELAPELFKLLSSDSPVLRRRAARLAGACAMKVDLEKVTREKPSKPVPEDDKQKELPELSKAGILLDKLKVMDRLGEMRNQDPDENVRLAAGVALDRYVEVKRKLATDGRPP